MTNTEPLVICTAWNAVMAKHGELCSESILQHIRRVEANGGTGITFQSRLIPEDYSRPPSWFKLDLIKELLATSPHVLWIDTDAVMVDQDDIREVWADGGDLLISSDENGLNCGVMGWNASENSNALLTQLSGLYDEFKDHPWFETAAIQKIYKEGSSGAHLIGMPKSVWNCYSNEINPRTSIIHFAGFKKDEQLKLMEAFEIAIRRNGWGIAR